jgi:hypothetical protein
MVSRLRLSNVADAMKLIRCLEYHGTGPYALYLPVNQNLERSFPDYHDLFFGMLVR